MTFSHPPTDLTEVLAHYDPATIAPETNEQMFEAVYGELRRIAGRLMASQRADHTLQPTALVHEAYFRLVDGAKVGPEGRAHFLRIATRAMRQILINHARDRAAQKRGGGRTRVSFHDELAGESDRAIEVLDLHHALEKLARKDARMAQVVELRVFSGMRIDEAASVLGVSKRTVNEDWRVAKLWLADELLGDD